MANPAKFANLEVWQAFQCTSAKKFESNRNRNIRANVNKQAISTLDELACQAYSRRQVGIRADVFGRFAFAQRKFGNATMALDDPNPFAAGLAVMAGRFFE